MQAEMIEQPPAQAQAGQTHSQSGHVPAQPIASGSSQVNVGNTERIVSAVGGLLLTYWGLRGRTSWLATLAGGYLMYRGASGNCPMNNAIGRNTAEKQPKPLTVRQSLTIRKPKEKLYAFWRQLENLPRFMHHLEEVTQLDSRRSHWKVKVPTDVASVQWDAEIVRKSTPPSPTARPPVPSGRSSANSSTRPRSKW
ncbi:MAG: DUF2892 domain-containing protein [Cytophagales bacterium]|nr:DUF2892 domain-containing protein [Cytophagales bacterium]